MATMYWLFLAVALVQPRDNIVAFFRWLDPSLTGSLEGAPEEVIRERERESARERERERWVPVYSVVCVQCVAE